MLVRIQSTMRTCTGGRGAVRIQSTMRTCMGGGRGAVRVPVGRAVGQFLNDGGMVLEVGSGNETNLETLQVAC